jgi:hypothetical protein
MTLITSNILDPIAESLPPEIWNHPKLPEPVLKPVHAHWIVKKVHDVLEKGGYSHSERWLDLVLTGSLTTYQYSPESDVDISLFINSDKLPEWSRAEMIGLMIDNFDDVLLPGTTHPMQCYIVPKDIKQHDLYKKGLRSGYDIKSHHWIEPPDHTRDHDVEAVENGFYVYAKEQAEKMDRLLRYEPDKAVTFWHQIHERRRRDQAMGKGDFAESNIIYKFLNNRGLMPAISQVSGDHIASDGAPYDSLSTSNHTLQPQSEEQTDHESLNQSQSSWIWGRGDEKPEQPNSDHIHRSDIPRQPLSSELKFVSSLSQPESQSSSDDSSHNSDGYIHRSSAFDRDMRFDTRHSNFEDRPDSQNNGETLQWANPVDNENNVSYSLSSVPSKNTVPSKNKKFPQIAQATGEHVGAAIDAPQAPQQYTGSYTWGQATISEIVDNNEYENSISERIDAPHQIASRQASTVAAVVVETTNANGGCTINLQGQQPSKGFAFSADQANEQIVPQAQFGIEAVDNYITSHLNDLQQPGRYLGTWVSKGNVYLDVSQVHDDRATAYDAAAQAKQPAMYNLSDFSEIPIDMQSAPTQDTSNGFGYSPMGEEPIDQPLRISKIATPLPKSKIPVGKMTPEQLAEYRAAQEYAKNGSLNWLRENPRSPDNIVSHWNQTTPEHRAQGMSWYQDAHQAAQQIAQDRGITVNQAAGLIANYSPQQHWATNLEMASRAAAGQVIGGPKQPGQRGFMASRSQADVAAKIMGGEDYHNIFAGKKITSFGHLIEHGQNTDPNDPKVVIDRHALGVAHGGYADTGVYTHSKVSGGVRKDGSSPVYDDVSNMYRQAADTINADGGYDGVPIQPHQLQAATWLTRQRLNAEGGYSNDSDAVANRTRKIAEGSVNNWNAYAAENHPALVGKTPGTGFSTNTGAGGLGNQDPTSETPNSVLQ